MKRRKPLARRNQLRRTGRLARSGITRSSSLARAPLRRKPKRDRPAEGPLTPDAWRAAIYLRELRRNRPNRSPARSQLSGAPIPPASLSPANFHHVVPKSWLRREGLHDRTWDARNGMLLTEAEHTHHEDGTARIPASAIPVEARHFIAELPRHVDPYLETKYPTKGAR